ncbi:transposase [Arcticibacter tournemirensis]|uniref:IS66 family transposase n=1 Tax=Arcticibacter tournemirensis TaxID=699437 RepID=UPI0011500C86|nr:IS66 family transposase [Arcticibacter tournemirensis]TQM51269.1 transposase [Arcticibacter tournemirensis]TQM51762.1 transposase [Arcticibacter tournemirensis]
MQVIIPLFETLTREEYQSLVQRLLTRIEELEDRHYKDRRTLAEYAQLIWGKKSEKHIRALAEADLNTVQGEIPFADQPEIETSREKDAEETASAEVVPASEPQHRYQRRLKPCGRKKLSANLPREYVEILPENYHQEMVRIDAEITEELDYRPGSFFVRVISRPRFTDPRTKGVAIAPMPQRPVHKGIAGAGLLAWVLVSRFCDHLPYYRQVKMLNRYGEDIVNTSTMGRWVKESINLLAIIYSRMKEQVLQSDYLMADETTIKVLDTHKESGKHQGYIWGYLAPLVKLVVMDYAEGRAADYPEQFIGDYSGTFQTDAYGGYDKLLKDRKDMVHAGCWVHTRRNFFKALSGDKKRATEALEMIGALYALESSARDKGANEQEFLRMRQEFSLPILAELKEWAEKQLMELNHRAAIAEACRYMLKRWDKLMHYTTDGRMLPDTNLLEGRFRCIGLGRKNWLFAGNHQSAERSAIIYSITESCILNSIDPFSYLKDVLARLPYLVFAPKERLDELLPNNWKPKAQRIYTPVQGQDMMMAG